MEFLKDEFVLFSLILFMVSVVMLVVFLVSYNKIRMMIEKHEAKKKEEIEKSKKNIDTGKESFVQEIEKEYMTRLEKLQGEYGDKMLKTSTLVLKIKNITSTLNSQLIIKEIQDILKSNLPVTKAIIFLKKKDSDSLLVAGGIGVNIDENLVERQLEDYPVVAHSFVTKKLTHIDDTHGDRVFARQLDNARQKIIYSVPFLAIAEGELMPVGSIAIEKLSNAATSLSGEDISLLSMLASIIGNAIYNASDLESSKKFSEEQLRKRKNSLKCSLNMFPRRSSRNL